MVSIRLVVLTGCLLIMNIWFVFSAPTSSQIPLSTRKVIKDGLKPYRAKVYDNQRLYFCVIWQHFRQHFADENSPVLDFLADLHLTPRNDAGLPINLEPIRANLRQWIPLYGLGEDECPAIEEYIEHNIQLRVNLARLMNANGPRAQYWTLVNALVQDYVRYSQADAQARQRLIGVNAPGTPVTFSVFAQIDRARFLKTILRTFGTMVHRGVRINPVGAPGLDLLAEAALGQDPVPEVHQNVQIQQQDNQVPPVVGQVRQNRQRDRQQVGPPRRVGGQERRRGAPQRRDQTHQGRRNGPRQRPRPQRPANPEGHRPQP